MAQKQGASKSVAGKNRRGERPGDKKVNRRYKTKRALPEGEFGQALLGGIRKDAVGSTQTKLRQEWLAKNKAAAQESEAVAFRMQQVEQARTLMHDMKGLTRKVCELVLDEFAEVTVPEGMKRTAAAQKKALDNLTGDELRKERFVTAGQEWARRLLVEAYAIISEEKTAA